MPPIPNHELQSLIGDRIKQRCVDWDISSWQLADATGLTLGELKSLEDGTANPTIATINDIAYQLQVPLTYFFEAKR